MANENIENVKRLANLLEPLTEINRYDDGEDREAWNIAISFADLGESFTSVSDDLLPKLLNGNLNPKQRVEILLDIGEEFRHILYHIYAMKFYDYLKEPSESAKLPSVACSD